MWVNLRDILFIRAGKSFGFFFSDFSPLNYHVTDYFLGMFSGRSSGEALCIRN